MKDVERYRNLSNVILIILGNHITVARLMNEVNAVNIILVVLSVLLAIFYIVGSNKLKYKFIREIVPLCVVFIFNITMIIEQVGQNTLMAILFSVVNVLLLLLIIYIISIRTKTPKI